MADISSISHTTIGGRGDFTFSLGVTQKIQYIVGYIIV